MVGRGFTLIEVLVAVLVLALALGASINVLGSYADVQGRIERRGLASLAAWNAIIERSTPDRGRKKNVILNDHGVELAGARLNLQVSSRNIDTEPDTDMRFYEVKVYAGGRRNLAGTMRAYLPERRE